MKQKCTQGKTRHLYIDTRKPYRKLMREKLDSDEGREIYMKRQGLVEPVHGKNLKTKLLLGMDIISNLATCQKKFRNNL